MWQRWIGRSLLLMVAAALAGCPQEQRRLPYIPPQLANWPQPYRGVPDLQMQIFVTGYIEASHALLSRGASLTQRRQLPVPVLLLRHPRQGLILIDAGLSPEKTANSDWPVGLIPLGAEISVTRAPPLRDMLAKEGLQPDRVRWIVLTHLRFTRTGAVEQFPQARVVVNRTEREHARQPRRGYNPSEIDDVTDWKFVDFGDGKPLATFKSSIDLFGDGSIYLIEAAGVTPGSFLVLIRGPERAVLWAGDAAPRASTLRTTAEPAGLSDAEQWWDRLWRIKRFADLEPRLIVAPGYEPQALADALSSVPLHGPAEPTSGAARTPSARGWERFLPR